MKTVLLALVLVIIFSASLSIAQYITEEEFVVKGQPASIEPIMPTVVTPTTTTVTTTPLVVPAEQEVYPGMLKQHVIEKLGQPAYVEKFKSFTRRHHGIYDEVWTYKRPTGTLVLYIKERRVMKVESQ